MHLAALDVTKVKKMHYSVDTCGAMFVHGKFTLGGYQSAGNQMFKR